MFHRFFRCILLSSLLIAATPRIWAQDCPDTQPVITGADIACDQNAASVTYTYSTPATTGTPTHSYQWAITPATGYTILGASNQNQLQVKWQTVGTYTVQVTEWNNDPTFTGCIGKVATKTITVQPLLHAYFYYQFDPAGGCFYNVVNFTGDVSVHADPSITYSWNFGDGSPIVSGPTAGVLQHTFPAVSGVTYTVVLTVTNSAGQSDQITDYVYVNPDQYKPVATFTNTATPLPANCLYNPMTFDGSGSLAKPVTNPENITILYYEWDFDDPGSGSSNQVNTGTTPTVNHVFKDFGMHHVKLTITNSKYCTNSITKDVFIDNTIPTASFTTSLACLGEATRFTTTSVTPIGTLTQLEWIYGDGSAYTSTDPTEAISHTYLSLGTYSAKLRVTNSNGCISDYFVAPVSVNPSPMASFLVGNACLGEAVAFTNTSTLNGGSQISSYLWNFDDPASGSNTSNLTNPDHLFSALGSYHVSLQATNSDGCANTYTISPPLVVNPKPAVDFTFQNGTVNWEIVFHNLTPPSVGNNLVWDYGDGTYGYGPNPSHIYQGPGNFFVTLTATDAINGCSNSIQKQVTMLGNASAFFTTDSPKCIADTMHFTPQIPGGNIVKEVWDYGDGTVITYSPPTVFPVFATHPYTQSGTFTVTRTVTYITNFYESFSIQVTVYPLPTASFTYSNNPAFPNSYACANQAVYFTDLSSSSTGNIIDWQWDFGDPGSGVNNTSVLTNPSHVFSGTNQHYNVTLKVTDNVNNCTSTIVKDVFVHPPVPTDFTFTNNTCLDQVVTFTANLGVMVPANIATWDWDFGDGTAHTTSPLGTSHLYAAAGNYTAILTVTDLNGCTNSVSKTVTIMPKPVAGFTFASPTCDSIAVQFTDQSYVPAGFPGYITKWIWTWGDGTADTVNFPASPNLSHVFPGVIYNFTVKLTITSSFGCKDSITHPIHIIPAPTAAFEVLPGTPSCATQVVQFNDLSQTNGGGNIVSWLWNFDDPGSGINNTSTSPSPSHTFLVDGTYQVHLIVTNANGCSNAVTIPVVIHKLPVANFSADSACAGGATQFTDLSIVNASAITSYNWTFGDGGTSTLQSPLHTYATFGIYNATLTIVNTNGCISTVTKQVTVYPNPVPSFTFSAASCIGNPVTFTDLSFIPSGFSGYIKRWVWNFGDGSAPMGIDYPNSPNVTYTFLGTATSHVVRLTVITTNNCTDSIEKTVNSIPSPIANFSHSNTTCLGQTVQFTDLSQTNGGGGIQNWNWDFGDPLSGANNTSTLQHPLHAFTSAGPFTVILHITSTNGCTHSDTAIVTINALPVANFTNTSACEGSTTTFTDTSVPNAFSIISYSWNFGDGGNSNLQNPLHTYAAYGTYTVTLTVVNSNGCIHSVSKQVTVNPKPVPDFTFSPASCVGNPVSFNNQSFVPTGFSSYINRWDWDFGDGSVVVPILFPSNPNTVHTFLGTATSHIVKLKVYTTTGCVDSISKTVVSIPSPIANFSYSNTLCLGQQVSFTDLTQANGGGSIQTWNWNFGDPLSGANNTSTLQNPTHAFTAAGSYVVTLVVTSSNGCVNTYTPSAPIVINALPTSNFTWVEACEGFPTAFTDASTSPGSTTITSYAWNFGDGGTSTSQSPSHIFATYGTYSVTLTITNSNGCIHTVTKQVLVNPKAIADFSFSAASCVGNPVSFTNQSFVPTGFSSSISQWQWDFGDGSTIPPILFPANPNMVHVFAGTATSHVVTLTVTTTAGCVSSVSKTVTSVPAPIANFSVSSTNCDNQPVQFTDLSQTNGGGSIQSWSWNFGDPASGMNNSATIPNPIHQFTSASTYTITLIVTNGNGCKDTLLPLPTITINARPTANFSADTVCKGTLTTFTDLSSGGTIASHLWDFGDGQTSSTASPTHLYLTPGTFNVKLTVMNSLGCLKDTTKQVLVLGEPTVLFSYSSPNCAGDSVLFTDYSTTPHGSIQEWTWDFGDGTVVGPIIFPNNQNIKHLYTTGGNYNVKLTILTSDGCEKSKTSQVQIGFHPLANFSFGTTGCALKPLQFTDLSQTNGGPAITTWSWNFGDPSSGSNNVSTTQNPTHNFTAGGTYTVRLMVTNANGCNDSVVGGKTVTVNAAPVAIFSADTSCLSSPTQFTDASTTSSGTISAWLWTFGDPSSGTNNTSTLQNPTHIYNTQGTYNVTLLVTNSNQCDKDTTMQIVVNPKPNAMFQYTASCVNSETQFTDMSTAPGSSIKNWYWDFGDGTPTATIQNPTHIYTTSGTYQVRLRVTNLANCEDSVTIPVIARPTPVAAFNYNGYFCPKGKVDFQDISTATGSTIAQREWIFQPGYTSNIPNPSHTFPVTDTTYLVTLIVTDTYGCKDTIVDSVFVKPGFSFAFNNDTVCQGYITHFTPVNKTPGDTLYSVSWNFGDPTSGPNNTSTLYSPMHTFTAPGSYIVKMKAYNSDNCVDSVYKEVRVYAAPQPLYTFVSTPCDSTVYFTDSTVNTGTGGVATWHWRFGDGTPDVIINAPGTGDTSHLYVNAGIYPVTLIVTNIHGCMDSITQNVQRFPCIKAGFTFKDTLCARYKIAFSDSSLPVTRINQWHWTWGDGTDTTYTTHSNPIMHTYADSGSYNVNLEIQALVNGTNIIDNLSSVVKVHPTPNTLFSNIPVCLHQVTLFKDTSKTYGQGISKWSWTFSAKSTDTSTFKNPSHTYDTAGIYNVKLVVTNKFGCKDSLTKPTRVYGLPVAAYENTPACEGDPTYFLDKSLVSDTTLGFWHWSFGDSLHGTSTVQDPNYRYRSTGTYLVRLIVKDHFGCIDTVDSTAKVNVTPVSSFTVVNGYNGKQGQVKMNNVSSGADSYKWDFGNNKFSTEENPVALYTEDGTYTIKLISLNQFECSDTTLYKYELLFKGLYVPNAFSPTSTNLGIRLFQPVGVNLKQYHITVFDSWGHLMWESTKLDDKGMPAEGWDGTYQGVIMPQGNYMWRISASFVDDSIWEGSDIGFGNTNKTMGTVSLIR